MRLAQKLIVMMNFKLFFLSLFCFLSMALAKEEIIQFSASAQGNGYNWAATLGWLSESLKQTALHAKQVQLTTKEKVKINVLSVSGGSSSAAVAILLDAALGNPTVNLNPESRTITPDEALKVANLISFVARGSDYDLMTVIFTTFRALSAKMKAYIVQIINKIPLLKQLYNGGVPRVNSNMLNRKIVMSDFGRLVSFARSVDYKEISKPLKEISGYESLVFLAKTNAKIKSIVSEIEFISDSPTQSIKDFDLAKDFDSDVKYFLDWQKRQIKKIIDKEVQSKVGYLKDKFRRFGQIMTPHVDRLEENATENIFQKVLRENLGDGVMTAALVKEFKNVTDYKKYLRLNKKIIYDNLKLYVFMNEKTAREILNSDIYRNAILSDKSFLKRYVIAVVDQRWTAINNSIQEPGLFEDLYGNYHSEKLRIKYIFDPVEDRGNAFLLRDTSSVSLRDRIINVVGGFPYQPILSMIQSFYNSHMLARVNYKESLHFTFEKNQAPEDKNQFSISLLESTLKPLKLEDPSKNVADYVEWYEEGKSIEEMVNTSPKNRLIKTKILWDIHMFPAQLVNLGHILFFKGKLGLLRSVAKIQNFVESYKAVKNKTLEYEKDQKVPQIGTSCIKLYQ
jgi:hypothetical protein